MLSELNEGDLRLFGSDRNLEGVPTLTVSFVDFLSSRTVFICMSFFSFRVYVPEFGRLPDVESVRAGEWDRDDDGE